jgi:hypothetical protein
VLPVRPCPSILDHFFVDVPIANLDDPNHALVLIPFLYR